MAVQVKQATIDELNAQIAESQQAVDSFQGEVNRHQRRVDDLTAVLADLEAS